MSSRIDPSAYNLTKLLYHKTPYPQAEKETSKEWSQPAFCTFAFLSSFSACNPCGARLFCGRGPFASTVGTEELGHLEMIGALVHQLTRNLNDNDVRIAEFAPYFVDHTTGVYPTAASGFPWSAASIAVKGDVIGDLTEDMAAEQKARITYDNILRLVDDPDILDPIRFLREREIVHFQRFGEAMELLKDGLDRKNVYYMNPALPQQR